MTTIVALRDQDTVYMGSDSLIRDNMQKFTAPMPKVFIRDGMLFGSSGALRLNYLLRWLDLPKRPDSPYVQDKLIDKYLQLEFLPALQTAFKEADFYKRDQAGFDGDFMIGVLGRLYLMNEDFCLERLAEPFHAIGSGSAYALGCLATLGNRGNPEIRVRRALATAARFDIGTGQPFHVLSLGRE